MVALREIPPVEHDGDAASLAAIEDEALDAYSTAVSTARRNLVQRIYRFVKRIRTGVEGERSRQMPRMGCRTRSANKTQPGARAHQTRLPRNAGVPRGFRLEPGRIRLQLFGVAGPHCLECAAYFSGSQSRTLP